MRVHDVFVASAMFPAVFIGIIDTEREMELHGGFSWKYCCCGPCHLLDESLAIRSRPQRIVQFLDVSFAVTGESWRVVNERIAGLLFWDDIKSEFVRVYIFGCAIPDIFEENPHVTAVVGASLTVASEGLEHFGWAWMNDQRHMSCLRYLFGLKSLPYGYSSIYEGRNSSSSSEDHNEFSYWASGAPRTAIGLFALIVGFLGGAFGFVISLLALLFNGEWRRIIGGFGVIVASLIFFHSGMWWLLR